MSAGGEFLKKAAGSVAKGAAAKAADKASGPAAAADPGRPIGPGTRAADPKPTQLPSPGTDRAGSPSSMQGTTARPSAKDQAKEIATGAAVDAAQGAVQGAVVGGAAGAAVGAVKGAAIGLAKDRRVQKIVLGLVAILAVIALAIPVITAISGSVIISSIVQGKDANSSDSVTESGINNSAVSTATNVAARYGLPWTLVLAATQKDEDADLQSIAATLDELDPDQQYRDLTAGAVYQWNERAMVLSEEPNLKALSDKVQEVTVAALVASGFSDQDAASVFAQARSWAIGEGQCTTADGTTVGVVEGDTFIFDGVTYTAKQVAIMKTVIGVAKTMYPANQKEAAIIGLITTAVESGFKNYANDGIITDLDGNLSATQRASYEKLKYSLTLDHDAVGTDHSSVGIVQQQALFGWGAITGSTWATDPEGVIRRLMTPSFAIARFLERMQSVTGWATMEPGTVAQKVQVSAVPDAYATRLPLAEAIWTQYADQSEAIAVPAGINWTGGTDGDADGDGAVTAACGENAGGAGIPTGDAQALAVQLLAATDRGEIIWEGYAETLEQVKRYANGDPIPETCTLDIRVLQTIVMADELLHKLSVNSLNRRCTGTTPGAGTKSYHWKGRAVDFGFLGGTRTTGGDPNSILLIKAFAEVAPAGAGVGQLGCQGRGRITQLNEFEDTCHHLHLEMGPSDTPFTTKGTP